MGVAHRADFTFDREGASWQERFSVNFSPEGRMVDPKLGTKCVCEACGAKFYDLNKSPAGCPKCGHSYDPAAAMAVEEPVRDVAPVAEKKEADNEDALEDDDDAMSLEDMADEEAADSDDDDDDDALEQFDEDEALLDDEEEEEESFLEEDDDDA
jgi:uncharacterized protein (TIGR02300 family)